MKKTFFALIAILLTTLQVIPVELDLRNRTESVTYYLAFIVRSSEGLGLGHVYVAWGKEDAQKQMSWGESYGFYPITSTEGLISLIVEVPGKIENEIEKGGKFKEKKYLVVKVNEDQFEKTRMVFKKWKDDVVKDQVKYKLQTMNCNHFVRDVILSLNLKAPTADKKFPLAYFEELVKSNQ